MSTCATSTPTEAELTDEHARLLERTAYAMFARGVVSLVLDDECLRAEPWATWETRGRQAALLTLESAGAARSSGRPTCSSPASWHDCVCASSEP